MLGGLTLELHVPPLVTTFPKLGQARLEFGFPSVRLQHPDLYALDLLATILGGGESSMLVEQIRVFPRVLDQRDGKGAGTLFRDGEG